MDLDRMIEQAKRAEYLPENDLKNLCEYVRRRAAHPAACRSMSRGEGRWLAATCRCLC